MINIKITETLRNWKSIIKDLFSILGIIVFIVELANLLKISFFQNMLGKYYAWILLACILLSIKRNWAVMEKTFKLKNADVHITIVIKDVLKQKGSVIIPTNTTFDTTLQDSFISLDSIQGQFQKRYFEDNLNQLDILLKDGIVWSKHVELKDSRRTNIKRYELGTVSKVNWDNNHYYFLAVSDINEHGKTINVSYNNLTDSISRLWQQLEEFGNIESISMPLICTGKAGISDITRFKAFREIVDSFIAVTSQSKLTENFYVIINSSDVRSNKINFFQACEYVRLKCEFNEEPSTFKTGTSIF